MFSKSANLAPVYTNQNLKESIDMLHMLYTEEPIICKHMGGLHPKSCLRGDIRALTSKWSYISKHTVLHYLRTKKGL